MREGGGGVYRLETNPLRRVALSAATALLVTVALALAAAVARAEVTHHPLFHLSEIPAEGPHGEHVALPGPLRNMESMTVDDGHLWAAEKTEHATFSASRVDEFEAATGAFIAQPVHVETSKNEKSATVYGGGFGEGIAVGHGAGEPSVYVAGQVEGKPAVSVFSEGGALQATWRGAAVPDHSFGHISDIAVDDSTSPLDAGRGDVIVANGQRGGRIDVFHPEADGEERYVGQITGISPSEPIEWPGKVAVNEVNGDLMVLDYRENDTQSVVDVFEPTGLGGYAFVRKIVGPSPRSFHEPATITVDGGNGELYVSELAPKGYFVNQNYLIDEFSATGIYLGHVEDIPDAFAFAADPVLPHDLFVRDVVYGPDVVIPDVTTGPISSLTPRSVTLSGTVDPDGAGVASCQFEWGTTTAFGKTAPCSEPVPNGEGAAPVHAELGGFERNTTYYYRLQATDKNGTNLGEPAQDQQFTTKGAVIGSVFVTDVSDTGATFGATIDPGQTPTSFYIQYGTSTAYGQTTLAAPGEAIGSGSSYVEVPVRRVQSLQPSTVYHYRVVAVSETQPGEVETIDGPDRTFTTQAASGSFALADGRQWELVSPASKLGALIEEPNFNFVQAAAAGNAVAYRSSSPTEEAAPGYASGEMVISTRGAGGWSSQDISEPNVQATHLIASVGDEFQIFSEDLSQAAFEPAERSFTPLSPEASESTAYLRTNYLGGDVEDHCRSGCYLPLVTGKVGFANVPPGTVFGEEPNGTCEAPTCGPLFKGASRDLSHIVLSSPVQLTPTPAPAGGVGLYEWSEGHLQLIDVLPKGEEGPAVLAGTSYFVDSEPTGVRGSVSENGQRVVLEGGAEGGKGLYLRDVAAGETIRLDVPQGTSGPSKEAAFVGANGDASRIYFLDSGPLLADSSPSGTDLYEYDLDAAPGSRLTDLSADPNAGRSAGVATMIGASEDGSYVYFAAGGALAPGATEGECPEVPQPQEDCNLYVRHEGATRLVATLPASEFYDWEKQLHGADDRGMYARVSPDGHWLAFLSSAELTGYDTRDAVNGTADIEVYLYNAVAESLVCASCNPTGTRPTGALDKELQSTGSGWAAASVPPWRGPLPSGPGAYGSSHAVHQPRYLSDTGRLFFDSTDALVPQDVNGVEDVYEYEPVGVGSCTAASATFGPRSEGCVNLVSSGTSPASSTFIDASETGGDVFFETRERLAPQDYDTAPDMYDAHECTSAVPCAVAVTQPPPCETEASCKAPPAPQPALYGAPASATFSGTANLTSTPVGGSNRRSKPKKRAMGCKRRAKHGCAKPKTGRHKRHAPENARSHHGGKR